jgi:hypothetical protein
MIGSSMITSLSNPSTQSTLRYSQKWFSLKILQKSAAIAHMTIMMPITPIIVVMTLIQIMIIIPALTTMIIVHTAPIQTLTMIIITTAPTQTMTMITSMMIILTAPIQIMTTMNNSITITLNQYQEKTLENSTGSLLTTKIQFMMATCSVKVTKLTSHTLQLMTVTWNIGCIVTQTMLLVN